jgi:hypothetical protein
MTTKVIIACPDNSVHNALVYVETRGQDGAWTRGGGAIVVEPRGQCEPLYLTESARIVIEEQARATAEPHA